MSTYEDLDYRVKHSETPYELLLGGDENSTRPISWEGRAIQKIDHFQNTYLKTIPNLFDSLGINQCIDDYATRAETIFNELNKKLKLNDWLHEDELTKLDELERSGLASSKELWIESIRSIALFFAKLPFRAARNIINMLISIIKLAVNLVRHPVDTTMDLARMIVHLLKALTEPETWSKMGAGMIGASAGQVAVGNPLAPIGLIIGIALMAGGLSFGAIQAAYVNREKSRTAISEAIIDQLIKQTLQLPEAMLTGFLMGLMFGALQKPHSQKHFNDVRDNRYDYVKNKFPSDPRASLAGYPTEVIYANAHEGSIDYAVTIYTYKTVSTSSYTYSGPAGQWIQGTCVVPYTPPLQGTPAVASAVATLFQKSPDAA